jgi:hypothetical protein
MPVGDYYAKWYYWFCSCYRQRFRLVCHTVWQPVVETAGLLKWISWFENSYAYKDTVKLVKYRNGIDLDPDAFL